ncbi:MAG: TerB family tellurite resistance protein [Flavobacteriaceae bacterium]
MNIFPQVFTVAEKLAIVQVAEAVILADGRIHPGELRALGDLMAHLDCDPNTLVYSRQLPFGKAMEILSGFPYEKKHVVAHIMEEMAKADGYVHELEVNLIRKVFESVGISGKGQRVI